MKRPKISTYEWSSQIWRPHGRHWIKENQADPLHFHAPSLGRIVNYLNFTNYKMHQYAIFGVVSIFLIFLSSVIFILGFGYAAYGIVAAVLAGNISLIKMNRYLDMYLDIKAAVKIKLQDMYHSDWYHFDEAFEYLNKCKDTCVETDHLLALVTQTYTPFEPQPNTHIRQKKSAPSKRLTVDIET